MAARFSGALRRTCSSSAEAVVELADLDQRAAERDARGNVRGMPQQSRAAGLDRFGEHAEAAVLLGERREGDRRRVPLDPALQFLESRRVGHDGHHQVTAVIGTATARLVVVRPALSVTVSVT